MTILTHPAREGKGRRAPARSARVVRRFTPADGTRPADLGRLRLAVGKLATFYRFALLSIDRQMGRFAVWLTKDPADEGYHVLVAHDGTASCDCMGHLRWGRCKHADATLALLAAGKIDPPPPA